MEETKLFKSWINNPNIYGALIFLVLLLAGDFAFAVLHVLQTTDLLDNYWLSLEADRGAPEFYQYMKELCIVVLLLSVRIKSGMTGFSVWMLLFLYLLCDDAFSIHEILGDLIGTTFNLPSFIGLRTRDLGELVVSGMVAILLLPALFLAYVRGESAFRQATRHLVLLLLALAFFGVFVDTLHSAVQSAAKLNASLGTMYALLGIVEDGGEMVVMSLIVCYASLLFVLDGDIGVALRRPQ